MVTLTAVAESLRTKSPRGVVIRIGNKATFSDFISHILFGSADKKMFGVLAGRIIASVTDKHSFRDSFAIGKFPTKTMSPISVKMLKSEFSIPVLISTSLPHPTVVISRSFIGRMIKFFSCRLFKIRVTVFTEPCKVFVAKLIYSTSVWFATYLTECFSRTLLSIGKIGHTIQFKLSVVAPTQSKKINTFLAILNFTYFHNLSFRNNYITTNTIIQGGQLGFIYSD